MSNTCPPDKVALDSIDDLKRSLIRQLARLTTWLIRKLPQPRWTEDIRYHAVTGRAGKRYVITVYQMKPNSVCDYVFYMALHLDPYQGYQVQIVRNSGCTLSEQLVECEKEACLKLRVDNERLADLGLALNLTSEDITR